MNSEQNEHLDQFEKQLLADGLLASSTGSYRRSAAEYLAWRQGKPSLASLEPLELRKDAEGFFRYLQRHGNGNSTLSRKMAGIENYFRHLVETGVIPANPIGSIRRPPRKNGPLAVFEQSEILKMFAACDITREKGLRDAVFLVLGAMAGLCLGEIVSANLQNVHLLQRGRCIDLAVNGRSVSLWEQPSAIVRSLTHARMDKGAGFRDPLLVSYKKSGEP